MIEFEIMVEHQNRHKFNKIVRESKIEIVKEDKSSTDVGAWVTLQMQSVEDAYWLGRNYERAIIAIKLENLVIDNFDKADFDSLDLTPQAEITRLQKVLQEKNTLIADFKQYDEERKRYIHRLEKQIITLRNKNQELNKRITK